MLPSRTFLANTAKRFGKANRLSSFRFTASSSNDTNAEVVLGSADLVLGTSKRRICRSRRRGARSRRTRSRRVWRRGRACGKTSTRVFQKVLNRVADRSRNVVRASHPVEVPARRITRNRSDRSNIVRISRKLSVLAKITVRVVSSGQVHSGRLRGLSVQRIATLGISRRATTTSPFCDFCVACRRARADIIRKLPIERHATHLFLKVTRVQLKVKLGRVHAVAPTAQATFGLCRDDGRQ